MARPDHQHIVPALLARRVQIDTNYWLGRQTRSCTNVRVPDFLEVCERIACQTDWASDIPARYLIATSPTLTAQPPAGTGAPAATSATAGWGAPVQTGPSPTTPQHPGHMR
jgi:hypothetical protein